MSTVEKKQTENTVVKRIFRKILSALLRKREKHRVRVLTYREVVRRLLCCRPSSGAPFRGAVIRESHGKGFRLFFLYLDENGLFIEDKERGGIQQVLIADSLDDELSECFGDGDLLIFD